jgi:DNA processing protein
VSDSSDTVDRLRLARTEGVGPIAYRRLLRRYGTADAALQALPGLARAGGRSEPPAIPAIGDIKREIDTVHRLGARLLFLDRSDYPPLLALLGDAPPVIAVLGDVGALACRAVALVGSRNASANGQRIAETLAAELAAGGLVVVSGLARGIDTAAHEGALAAGRTVACVAGGLDVHYPPENAALQARIAAAGAIVAEAPPGTAPQARHFPRRNRIIAGLSLGVVVIEAALRSGSLITARVALDANREVFAVPGSPLDPRCRGSNGLLREGAHLTETAADVFEHFRDGLSRSALFAPDPGPRGLAEPPPEWPAEAEVAPAELVGARSVLLDLLAPSPTRVDDLVRRCQFSAAAVMSILLELELAGRVEMLTGNRVALLDEPGS